MRVDGIESEDDLKKAQAAAQAQGTSVTDYKAWSDILKQFDEYGVQSTGSYAGDKAKMQEIEQAVQEYVQEMQVQETQQPKNKEPEKVQEITKTDREQEIKATVVNATSDQIMADYMKYYHLLM